MDPHSLLNRITLILDDVSCQAKREDDKAIYCAVKQLPCTSYEHLAALEKLINNKPVTRGMMESPTSKRVEAMSVSSSTMTSLLLKGRNIGSYIIQGGN